MLNYRYKACAPGYQKQVVDMAINGNGIRDTNRVLEISKTTIIKILKSTSGHLVQVNPDIQNLGVGIGSEVCLESVCMTAELGEQSSFVGNKSNQRWLWHAVDHATNTVLAYVLGKRKDKVFQQLKALLDPFSIQNFYTDDWVADKQSRVLSGYLCKKTHLTHYQFSIMIMPPTSSCINDLMESNYTVSTRLQADRGFQIVGFYAL